METTSQETISTKPMEEELMRAVQLFDHCGFLGGPCNGDFEDFKQRFLYAFENGYGTYFPPAIWSFARRYILPPMPEPMPKSMEKLEAEKPYEMSGKGVLEYRCRGVDYKYAGMVLQTLMDHKVFSISVISNYGYEIRGTFVNIDQMCSAEKQIEENASGVFCSGNYNFFSRIEFHQPPDYYGLDELMD